MRISDWSSDVCSSDLGIVAWTVDPRGGKDPLMVAENQRTAPRAKRNVVRERVLYARAGNRPDAVDVLGAFRLGYFGDARRGQQPEQHTALHPAQTGRAAGRERVCQYG